MSKGEDESVAIKGGSEGLGKVETIFGPPNKRTTGVLRISFSWGGRRKESGDRRREENRFDEREEGGNATFPRVTIRWLDALILAPGS
jgi:hypothetical protein